MKLVKKALSVTLSLVLCASLVAPGFAATFKELNAAISTGKGVEGKISVTDSEDGSRVIDLHENVEYSSETDQGVTRVLVRGKKPLTLNMNGYAIDAKHSGNTAAVDIVQPGVILTVNGGTRTDEETGKTVTGTITGGGKEGSYANSTGGGINALKSTVNLNGVTITDNYANAGSGVYVSKGSTVTATDSIITGNHAKTGGGVYVGQEASFTMDGGEISENHATFISADGGVGGGSGGGIYNEGTIEVKNGAKIKKNYASSGAGINNTVKGSVTVTGSSITENSAIDSGGGIGNYAQGSVNVTGSTITGNKATGKFGTGGGIYTGSQVGFTITKTTITENSATEKGGGISVSGSGAVLTMNGGKIYGNEAGVADDVYIVENSHITLPDASGMDATLKDKTEITGWYHDRNGWGEEEGDYPYYRYDSVNGSWSGEGYLKAAHDQYFQLTDGGGKVLADVEKGTEIDVSKLEEPTREGYRFAGWTLNGQPVGETVTMDGPIKLEAQWERTTTPSGPVITPVEIDEPDVPLAGLPPYLTPAEPEDRLTRAQVVAILHWMDSEPAAELATFIDVLADSDYAEAIGWAQKNGIALDMGGNRFAPDEYVTRGQLIEFLNRYAAYVGSNLVLELDGDADEILTWAVAEEIINDFFTRLYA